MNKEDLITIVILISLCFFMAVASLNKINELEDRIEKLEEDYKIYEINLNNLENNKEVQLEVE